MIDRTRSLRMEPVGMRTKIGAVTYLNSRPLIEGLQESLGESRLVLDYPSRLADDLARGRLSVALIPSVESFAHSDYQVVSDACVATHGPVLSVKMHSRVHPGDIRTLAIDEGSRTSVALCRLMLRERFGVQPELELLPLGVAAERATADAVLLIGDRAMSPPQMETHTTWDLGEEWVRWTGLPFVFAMWVARGDQPLGQLPELLAEARDRGVKRLDAIAHSGANELHLPLDVVQHYLRRNLHFHLGSAERQGLRLFRELAGAHDLIGPAALAHVRDRHQPEDAALANFS